jgi:hypothetical protein
VTADPYAFLTPAERQELQDIQTYIKGHAKAGTRPAEGSFNAVFNKASPQVRLAMKASQDTLRDLDAGGGRYRPFQDRIDIAAAVPKDLKPVVDAVETENLSHALNSRMGTPTEAKTGPMDRRELMSEAWDAHQQHEATTGAPYDV